MKKYVVLLLLLLTPLAQAEENLLRLHGSNTIGDKLAPVLAEKWLKSKGYSQVTISETAPEERRVEGRDAKGRQLAVEIRAHGSTTAFTDLAAGSADLGMASRPIKAREVAQLVALGKLDDVRSEYVVGLDGVAVIVHPANPLATLDKAAVRRIFAGEVDDWSQLGGKAGAIRVHARDDKSGTYDTFKSLVLDEGAKLVGTAGRYESSTELVAQVAADPQAIGFVGLAYIQGVKALAIADGGAPIAPAPFTVATEDYALARRLFLYAPTRGHNWQLAQDFASFAVSIEGQRALEPHGFVSQEIEARPVAHESEVPQEYARFTHGAQRLSLNFRFEPGVYELDNKAKRDLMRLAAYLARPENARRKLLLFGFADSHELLPIRSLVLSVDRADAVAEWLLMQGVEPYHVRGYGDAVAVASNDSDSGRHRNRRVEVWLQ
ncbi:MAG TPA: phosphate ABC transporter substrate-binding/OmpA family protein [Gammaproteobacteria bacterium]